MSLDLGWTEEEGKHILNVKDGDRKVGCAVAKTNEITQMTTSIVRVVRDDKDEILIAQTLYSKLEDSKRIAEEELKKYK